MPDQIQIPESLHGPLFVVWRDGKICIVDDLDVVVAFCYMPQPRQWRSHPHAKWLQCIADAFNIAWRNDVARRRSSR